MKKLLYLFPLFTLFLIAVGCEDTDTPTDTPTTSEFKPISEITAIGNQKNYGTAAGDELYIYGCKYDSEGAKLYRKDRESGEELVLDEITRISEDYTSDIGYFNLYIVDGYLYYIPYDTVDVERNGYLFRISRDGGQPQQITVNKPYEYCVYDSKIYYSVLISPEGMYEVDLDGGNESQIYSKCLSLFWIVDGKIYYQSYLNDGYFRSQLNSIELNDTSVSELVFDSQTNYSSTFTDNKELYCLDYSMTTKLTNFVKVDLETKDVEIIIEDVPFGILNSVDGDVYISFNGSSDTYASGIYRYDETSKSLQLLINAASSSICFIGNDQIVYANSNDQEYAGRFWQLYLTDILVSVNEILF